jgi:hypothetical protein
MNTTQPGRDLPAGVDSKPIASGPQPKAPRARCLVVFVPGMAGAPPGAHLKQLITGVGEFADNRQFTLTENHLEEAGERRAFTLSDGAACLDLAFTESRWSDLRPRLSAESGVRKVLGGLGLLLFWMASPKVWRVSLRSKYMFVSTFASLLLILAWYYGAVATLFTALGSHPDLQFPELKPVLAAWGYSMSSWWVWPCASAITALFPMIAVVDVAHAARAYLLNRDHFANKAQGRLSKVLYGAFKEDFDRIVVIAHSFGVSIAVEALAELEVRPKMPISLISLGGSLGLMRARCPRLDGAFTRLLKPNPVGAWSDFWSQEDWLGTPSLDAGRGDPTAPALACHAVDASVSFFSKLNGDSHSLYFSEPAVHEALLVASGWLPASAVAA